MPAFETFFRDDLVTGMWKFKDTVTPEELIKLAEEWRDSEFGYRYTELYIRQCSKDQFGIGFMYELSGEDYHSFSIRMKDMLSRRFGTRFVGWDFSKNVWVIKNLSPSHQTLVLDSSPREFSDEGSDSIKD